MYFGLPLVNPCHFPGKHPVIIKRKSPHKMTPPDQSLLQPVDIVGPHLIKRQSIQRSPQRHSLGSLYRFAFMFSGDKNIHMHAQTIDKLEPEFSVMHWV